MSVGVSMRVDANTDEVGRAIHRLAARVEDLDPVMDEIGASLVTSTQDRFERQEGPAGRPWRGLSTATLNTRKGTSAQILRDSGRLYRSITHLATDESVRVGSNVRYARIHQLGGQAGRGRKVRIEARPFLGLSQADREELLAIVSDHLGEA